MSHPVTVICIGAGSRGTGYLGYSEGFSKKFSCRGLAEPRKFYRDQVKENYDVQEQFVFEDWKQLAEIEKIADVAIIATPDRGHKEPAIAFAKKGYHIFLEKPMAVSYADCLEIAEACRESNVMLGVAHVLAYTPQAMKIREMVQSGLIGDVVNIQLLEPVGFWHFAHAFVRGNWRREDKSSFTLLTKSCHDIDLITYWMGDLKCTKISSFGSLKHFTKKNKPEGSSSRCMDCAVESSCPFSAKKVYLEPVKEGHKSWPLNIITEVVDIENVTAAIENGPYGKCVYDCDNDVVDNQVVNMEFEDGATVSFTMVAFTEKICERQVEVFGTKGQIKCEFGDERWTVQHYDFNTRKTTKHHLFDDISDEAKKYQNKGHSGADFFAINSFIQAIKKNDPSLILTGPEQSLRSHLLCFQAEKSRRTGQVIHNPEEGPFDGL